MARIRFQDDTSAPEELAKVKRFAPILDYFAMLFDVKLVIDAPHGVPVSPDATAEDTIFIHVFSVPEAQNLHVIGSAFGLDVPKPEPTQETGSFPARIIDNDVGSCFYCMGAVPTIYNRLGDAIACFTGRHLYILFDIAHREWPGDTIVLRHILAAALAHMLGPDMQGQVLAREHLTAGRLHKKLIARLPQLSDRLSAMFRTALVARIREQKEAQYAAVRVSEEASRNLIDLGFQTVELTHRLRHVERLIEKADIAQEFETLLSWSNVKGVRIEGDSLAVYTNPLTMENPDGATFLIGEYKIVITPQSNSNLAAWVQVAEYGWRGPYAHTVVRNLSTYCWGGVLRPALVKALESHDFVYAVSDALSFLIAESSAMHELTSSATKKPYTPSSFYQTEEDRAAEGMRYVEFIARLRKNFVEAKVKEELTKTQGRINAEAQKLFESQSAAREQSIANAFLERCAQALVVEEKLALLRGIPSLIALEVHGRWLWALFAPKLSPQDGTMKPGFALALSLSGSFLIDRLGSASTKICEPPSAEDQELLRNLALFGMFGTAFGALYAYATGEAQPFLNAQKHLEAFIAEHTFPQEKQE